MPSPKASEVDRQEPQLSLRERLAVEVERTYGKKADTPVVRPTNLLARVVAAVSSPAVTLGLLLVGALTGTTYITYPFVLAATSAGLLLALLRKTNLVGDRFGSEGGWFPIVFGVLWLALIVTMVYLPWLTPFAIAVVLLVLWRRVLHPLALLGNHMLHPDLDDPARL